MSIEQKLNEALKQAMRDKQADLLSCIRQIKAKVQEVTNAEGFSGPVDDQLYQNVITAYVRSLEKTFPDLEKAGDRGAALLNKYIAEIAYLKQYLPQLLNADETRNIVRQTLAQLGITDAKQMGKVTGVIMKEYKGRVDPALARQLIEEELAAKS